MRQGDSTDAPQLSLITSNYHPMMLLDTFASALRELPQVAPNIQTHGISRNATSLESVPGSSLIPLEAKTQQTLALNPLHCAIIVIIMNVFHDLAW